MSIRFNYQVVDTIVVQAPTTFVDNEGITQIVQNTLLINIETGNKYSINDIQFYGNYIFQDSIITSNISFEIGDFFSGDKFTTCMMFYIRPLDS